MTYLLLAAAVVSVVTFGVHTFIGGRFVARPLLADNRLPRASKWLNYYCWHITTILIVFIAVAFAWLAHMPKQPQVLMWLAALTTALSALSVVVALKGGIHPLRFPSTSLFAAVSVLGWMALAA